MQLRGVETIGVCDSIYFSQSHQTHPFDKPIDVWGYADVQAAIAAIPVWIDATAWSGPGVNANRVLLSGHSNGGIHSL